MSNTLLKNRAVCLRKQGLSYREILEQIPVAKSTLSLWLRDVGLTERQRQRLTEKKISSMLRGASTRRRQRLEKMAALKQLGKSEIDTISSRELWLMGIMLYWAEGSKEKAYSNGTGIRFSNSDPLMIKLFIHWLQRACKIENERISFEIYIHKNSVNTIKKVQTYWSEQTGFPIEKFSKVYLKNNTLKTVRKNTGEGYYGLVRVRVTSSSDLNRKLTGWIEGICEKLEK
ncbi:MAG: hypothetical protein A2748_02365 [Candidatus Wildermuthbacteria bacterium RIFCSPHIGHO2_01_FULL_45_20]|nr:MAG: hypothetical protein A2748_02365 [Candidatus Wildermuthbacteria bacterium RIFCSPHIGHO2_01_FULL_45_20]